jgi:hypothetical protein
MYGNPGLVSGGKWVAVQFRSTLLRVGTPWATCSDAAVQAAETYPVGSIMPILFGGPNLNSIALLAGNPSYLDVIAELEGVTVPVKVVLEIFNSKTGEGKVDGQWTDSKVDKQCYKAGNTCEEAHLVCKAEFCEMDVWKSLIASFKAAGSQTECGGPCVTVLGAVDAGTTTSEYDTLGTASGHADGPAWGASTICTDFADTLCDGGVQQGSGGAAVDGFYFPALLEMRIRGPMLRTWMLVV